MALEGSNSALRTVARIGSSSSSSSLSSSSSSSPSSLSSNTGFPSSLSCVHNQVLKVRLEEELLVKLAVGEAEIRLCSQESMATLLGPSPLGSGHFS